MTKPFIEVKNLRRTFETLRAVDGISFDLDPGVVTGLIGANGAGKTTTMRILATLDLPTAGTVRLDGVDVVEHPNKARRRLGWMPDHFTPYKSTTSAQYLDFFGRAQGFRGAELAWRLDETAEFTNLAPLRDRPMDKLSKGQLQRLCLARTLLSKPDFLILDEPVAGLDPKARLEFKNLIRNLSKQGKTILISSHILSELGEMCDTLLFMDRGKVVHHGETHALRRGDNASGTSFVTIVVSGTVAPVVAWINARPGWKLLLELKDGVRAEFGSGDSALLRHELKALMADDIGVADFHRDERRLEETFVQMLGEPASVESASTHS